MKASSNSEVLTEKRCPRWIYWALCAFLLVWGAAMAIHYVVPYATLPAEQIEHIDATYMSSRLAKLEDAMASVKEGSSVYPIQGGHPNFHYVYNAYLGVLLNISSAWEVLLFNQIAAGFLCFLLYPLMTFLITRSFTGGLLSPFILRYIVGDYLVDIKFDVYWALFWLVVASLPFFILLCRRTWDKTSWALFVAICLFMSFASIFREQAILSFFVLLLAVIFAKRICPALRQKKQHTWKKRTILAVRAGAGPLACLVGACLLVNTILLNLYLTVNQIETFSTSSQFWHTMYIGFGHEDNPYGIEEYNDWEAIHFVESVAPEAVEFYEDSGLTLLSYTDAYGNVLRDEIFQILRENPAFFFGSYLRKASKAFVLLGKLSSLQYASLSSVRNEWLLLALSTLVLILLRNKTVLKRYALVWGLLLACILLGLPESLLAVPYDKYMMASVGAVRALFLSLALAAIECLHAFTKPKLDNLLSTHFPALLLRGDAK